MSIYDSYGDQKIQPKAGETSLSCYNVGDFVTSGIKDGAYITIEEVIVINGGKVVAIFSDGKIFNCWGGFLELNSISKTKENASFGTWIKRKQIEQDSSS